MAPPVPQRTLGRDGPQVAALGFGLMGLSIPQAGKLQPDEERLQVLDRAYELGCTTWDSADAYGDNEDLVCKWFQRTGKRSEVFRLSASAVICQSVLTHFADLPC